MKFNRRGEQVDLTEGIRAERERIAGVIAGLEAQLAKWNAADRELEQTQGRLERLNLGNLPVPVRAVEKGSPAGRRMGKEEAVPMVAAHLERVGRATGTGALAETLNLSRDLTFASLQHLEEEGRVKIKRDGKKPMIIQWVGGEAKPLPRRQPPSPKGETEQRIREYLKANPVVRGGMVELSEKAEVPKGSIRGTMVKLEREGLVKIERHGPAKPATIRYQEPDGSQNGAASAQGATV